MAEPFLSEIRIFAFNFAPRGWGHCNGQLLPIQQNANLFSLIGTTYGGDGEVNFALPDLRGRLPMHPSNNYDLGERGGTTEHALTLAQFPAHTHTVRVSSAATNGTGTPANNCLGGSSNMYSPGPVVSALSPNAVTATGNSQAHPNMQPYTVLNFCIALSGMFPGT